MKTRTKLIILIALIWLKIMNYNPIKEFYLNDYKFIENSYRSKCLLNECPSFFEIFTYFLPKKNLIYTFFDIINFFYIRKLNFLFLSLMLPSSFSSIEIFILLSKKESLLQILTYINPFYIILEKELNLFPLFINFDNFYENSHLVNLNNNWFSNLNIFDQYSKFIYKIIWLNYLYISKLMNQKYLLIFLFKPSDLKYLLFLYYHYELNMGYFYFLCGVVYLFLTNDVFKNGVVNLNFVNWCCLACGVIICIEMFLKAKKIV